MKHIARYVCAVTMAVTLSSISQASSMRDGLQAGLEKASPASAKKLLDAKFVVFIAHGTSCPMVSGYYPRVTKLEKKFRSKGVNFAYINPSPHDSVKSIEDELKKFGVKTFYIHDSDQRLGQFLKLKTTTQAVIYDVRNGTIRYSGAIDDAIKFDVRLEHPKHDYVSDQLNLLLAGKDVTVNESDVYGCSITYKN